MPDIYKYNKYTVQVVAGMSLYTAYAGESFLRSQEVIDIVRSVLIMTSATAVIRVLANEANPTLVWTITNGEAHCNAVRYQSGGVGDPR